MNIIVAHDKGFSVDNDSTIDYDIFMIDDNVPYSKMYIKPKQLFNVVSEPSNSCQVLDDNGKGYFCIFESSRKILVKSEMTKNEVNKLKNNLKKWH